MFVHSLDASVFHECEFYKSFEESKLKGCIYNFLRKVYPSLTKMFYSSLYYIYGIISFKVIKHKISLPLEVFADVWHLPYVGPLFKEDESEEGKNYNYEIIASFFLLDLNSRISSPITIGPMCLDIRLIHYVTNHISFSTKIKFIHLTRSDISVICLLVNKVEANRGSVVIQHMIGSKKKGLCLPYYDLRMNILEHIGFNIEGEESYKM